jgi:hypothetical protein
MPHVILKGGIILPGGESALVELITLYKRGFFDASRSTFEMWHQDESYPNLLLILALHVKMD